MTDQTYLPATPFADAVDAVRLGEEDVDQAAAGLMAALTDEELLGLLDGDFTIIEAVKKLRAPANNDDPVFVAGRIDRLGIPGIRFTDGPRGVSIAPSTSFPVAIARAATWDVDVERSIGDAIGAEARVHGANLWGGLCVNVASFPGWGRAQESYGEEPFLIGEMGAAATEGAKPWVLSSVKHFALNSMEEARFQVDVQVPEDVLHESYLPHFRRTVEAGVDSVMSSYNSVNGEWAGENHHLLTDILRDQWGFSGFVHTDWIWGLRHPVESVAAGQDLEMPFRQQRAKTLLPALREGRLSRVDVTRAGSRILRGQLELALRARPTPPATVVAGPEHRALARDVARRGTVLLRNEEVGESNMLPLAEQHLSRIAVVGSHADLPNLGDRGSSKVKPPTTVSVLEGLRERLGNRVVSVAADATARQAADIAADADAAIVVVGLTPDEEGEALIALGPDAMALLGGILARPLVSRLVSAAFNFTRRWWQYGGDRADLRLHSTDVALIRAVAEANSRSVVVVIGGGTVVVDPWDREVAALLMAWYPGMEGGRAVVDVLLGDAEPAGRMPVTIPSNQSHLPRVDWNARSVVYDRWWGQRKLDRDGVHAAYPLGFGLGYTSFTVTDLKLGDIRGEYFDATVTVTNTGRRAGRHVVQIYALLPGQQRPVRALVGFASVALDVDAESTVTIVCSTRPLQRWTADGFVLDAGTVEIEAGAFSGDPQASAASLVHDPLQAVRERLDPTTHRSPADGQQ